MLNIDQCCKRDISNINNDEIFMLNLIEVKSIEIISLFNKALILGLVGDKGEYEIFKKINDELLFLLMNENLLKANRNNLIKAESEDSKLLILEFKDLYCQL